MLCLLFVKNENILKWVGVGGFWDNVYLYILV